MLVRHLNLIVRYVNFLSTPILAIFPICIIVIVLSFLSILMCGVHPLLLPSLVIGTMYDYYRCTWVYLLKRKFEVLYVFTTLLQMIKTQYHTMACYLCSDNGSEYLSNEFRSRLNKHGILQQLACLYSHEQNGVAARTNCSIMSIVWCLLYGMNVPKYFGIGLS